MRIIRKLCSYTGFFIFLAIGLAFIMLGLNIVDSFVLESWIDLLYGNSQVQFLFVSIGLAVIATVFLFMQVQSARENRDRTIAFDNPDGQVEISLIAIEEFIKKISSSISEVRELRPRIIAHKKGVDVFAKVVLFSGTNIPEVTEQVQSHIRKRVQDLLGIEEKIQVKLLVSSIKKVDTKKKEKEVKEKKEKPGEKIPFTGIRYPESLRETAPE